MILMFMDSYACAYVNLCYLHVYIYIFIIRVQVCCMYVCVCMYMSHRSDLVLAVQAFKRGYTQTDAHTHTMQWRS